MPKSAAILSRRESCSAIPERLNVAAPDDSSDDEWDPDEHEVAGALSDEENSDAEADGGTHLGILLGTTFGLPTRQRASTAQHASSSFCGNLFSLDITCVLYVQGYTEM